MTVRGSGLLALGVTLVLMSGCTTLSDARNAEGAGVKQTYQATLKQTWDASLNALRNLNLSVASENEQKGYILAQRGMSAFSYGENIALFVRRRDAASCTVEVVSKKAVTTNIFAPDWSQDIHNQIAAQLGR
jgi:hypothetical protein